MSNQDYSFESLMCHRNMKYSVEYYLRRIQEEFEERELARAGGTYDEASIEAVDIINYCASFIKALCLEEGITLDKMVQAGIVKTTLRRHYAKDKFIEHAILMRILGAP